MPLAVGLARGDVVEDVEDPAAGTEIGTAVVEGGFGMVAVEGVGTADGAIGTAVVEGEIWMVAEEGVDGVGCADDSGLPLSEYWGPATLDAKAEATAAIEAEVRVGLWLSVATGPAEPLQPRAEPVSVGVEWRPKECGSYPFPPPDPGASGTCIEGQAKGMAEPDGSDLSASVVVNHEVC